MSVTCEGGTRESTGGRCCRSWGSPAGMPAGIPAGSPTCSRVCTPEPRHSPPARFLSNMLATTSDAARWAEPDLSAIPDSFFAESGALSCVTNARAPTPRPTGAPVARVLARHTTSLTSRARHQARRASDVRRRRRCPASPRPMRATSSVALWARRRRGSATSSSPTSSRRRRPR